ncbi:MAG: hypothetical protein ACK5QT_11130 [Oligoflexia bacterium]
MSRKLERLQKTLFLARLVLAGVVSGQLAAADQPSDFVQLQTFKTHSRLTVKLDPSVEVIRQKTGAEASQGFEFVLKGLSLSDLGAPFGSESEWLRQLDGIWKSDPRLTRLRLIEQESGVLVRGEWKFPSGRLALASPAMDSFHYRKDQAYVIDFWIKPGPTLIQSKAAQARQKNEERLKQAEAAVQRRSAERRALAAARVEMEDSLRFCRDAWDEGREVFLPFVAAKSPFRFEKYLPQRTPDQDYPYSEPTGNSEEAQYFRLALKLYRKEKYALVHKTLDFFDRKFKGSSLAEESQFLRANAALKLGFEDQGILTLNRIIAKSQTSPAALHAAMFLALKKHQAGDELGAFESFMGLLQNHASHRLVWVFRMGVAEALASLKQTQRAVSEYRWIMENAPDRKSQVEGAVRIGDIFLERRQYDQALAAYFLASQEFGSELDRFPHFWINRAEALYWLGQYERAAEAFSAFQTNFGSHPMAWRASFRLSELEGRKGNEKKAQSLLVETMNRYPYSPGATLARARAMACEPSQRPGVEGLSSFFEKQMAQFDGDAQVVMDRFADFRGLAHVRALLAAGAEEKAIEVALKELDGRSDNAAKSAVAKMLEHLFRRSLLARLGTTPDDASRLSALSYYHEMGSRIPHFPGNVDSDYLLKLSQAAIEIGMPGWSRELAATYQQRAGSDRVIAMAADSSVDRKLLDSEKAYTEARAIWVGAVGDLSRSDEKLQAQVRELLSKVVEESPFSYEKELISALVESSAGKPALALTHLTKARALAPASERNAPRVLFLAARLHADSGNSTAASEAFKTLRVSKKEEDPVRFSSLGLPVVPDPATLLILESDQLTQLGRWGEIAALLGDPAQEQNLNSPLRYRFAMALARSGGRKNSQKSSELLKSLSESAPEEFWKTLAREALNHPKVNAKEGRL